MTSAQAEAIYGATLQVIHDGDPTDVAPASLARYMSGMELALELANRFPEAGARLLESFRTLSHADVLPGAAHAHVQGALYVASAINGVREEGWS